MSKTPTAVAKCVRSSPPGNGDDDACSLAYQVLKVCDSTARLPQLDPMRKGTYYDGPSFALVDDCRCSVTAYNLLAACSWCQRPRTSATNITWLDYGAYAKACPVDSAIIPAEIPSSLSLPAWATSDTRQATNGMWSPSSLAIGSRPNATVEAPTEGTNSDPSSTTTDSPVPSSLIINNNGPNKPTIITLAVVGTLVVGSLLGVLAGWRFRKWEERRRFRFHVLQGGWKDGDDGEGRWERVKTAIREMAQGFKPSRDDKHKPASDAPQPGQQQGKTEKRWRPSGLRIASSMIWHSSTTDQLEAREKQNDLTVDTALPTRQFASEARPSSLLKALQEAGTKVRSRLRETSLSIDMSRRGRDSGELDDVCAPPFEDSRFRTYNRRKPRYGRRSKQLPSVPFESPTWPPVAAASPSPEPVRWDTALSMYAGSHGMLSPELGGIPLRPATAASFARYGDMDEYACANVETALRLQGLPSLVHNSMTINSPRAQGPVLGAPLVAATACQSDVARGGSPLARPFSGELPPSPPLGIPFGRPMLLSRTPTRFRPSFGPGDNFSPRPASADGTFRTADGSSGRGHSYDVTVGPSTGDASLTRSRHRRSVTQPATKRPPFLVEAFQATSTAHGSSCRSSRAETAPPMTPDISTLPLAVSASHWPQPPSPAAAQISHHRNSPSLHADFVIQPAKPNHARHKSQHVDAGKQGKGSRWSQTTHRVSAGTVASDWSRASALLHPGGAAEGDGQVPPMPSPRVRSAFMKLTGLNKNKADGEASEQEPKKDGPSDDALLAPPLPLQPRVDTPTSENEQSSFDSDEESDDGSIDDPESTDGRESTGGSDSSKAERDAAATLADERTSMSMSRSAKPQKEEDGTVVLGPNAETEPKHEPRHESEINFDVIGMYACPRSPLSNCPRTPRASGLSTYDAYLLAAPPVPRPPHPSPAGDTDEDPFRCVTSRSREESTSIENRTVGSLDSALLHGGPSTLTAQEIATYLSHVGSELGDYDADGDGDGDGRSYYPSGHGSTYYDDGRTSRFGGRCKTSSSAYDVTSCRASFEGASLDTFGRSPSAASNVTMRTLTPTMKGRISNSPLSPTGLPYLQQHSLASPRVESARSSSSRPNLRRKRQY